MKKKNCLCFLALLLCLLLAACGGAPASASAASDSDAQSGGEAAATLATEAEKLEYTADLADFMGYWKYDGEPLYLVIDGEGHWYSMSLYGTMEQSGAVIMTDGAELYLENGDYYDALWLIDSLSLEDGAGNTLSYTGDMPLLPGADDLLDQTAPFPGDFWGVEVSYPSTLTAQEDPSRANSLLFTAAVGEGTEDAAARILLGFLPISGYDESMTAGLGTAQPQLEAMLQNVLTELCGDRLLSTADIQCADWGSYYSAAGTVTVDGSAQGLAEPLTGTVEVRYYGPTGYALVTVALAPAERLEVYSALSRNMLASCTYESGWSTAPKPVPETPAAPADGSDPGDAGTPYYWYDEDGDIWYWDGEKNEFIGFGNSYYIEDGQYYESNDAGWDYDDDYYDDWSDPGDTWDDDYYYDDWSDPGDTWEDDYYYDDYDDYEYYDDGWGDDF